MGEEVQGAEGRNDEEAKLKDQSDLHRNLLLLFSSVGCDVVFKQGVAIEGFLGRRRL